MLKFCWIVLFGSFRRKWQLREDGESMLTLHGIGTSTGVGDGPLYLYTSQDTIPKPVSVNDTAAETQRADNALRAAREELLALSEASEQKKLSDRNVEMFNAQSALLEDADFLDTVHSAIQDHSLCAEYAVYSTARAFASQLRTLEDEYLQERGDDVLDVAHRVLNLLCGNPHKLLQNVTTRVVLAAETLLPSEAMQLDRKKIAAFVMRSGGASTHTAILLRELGIPTVLGLDDAFDQLERGARTMVDGSTGLVVQNPDTRVMSELAGRMLQLVKEERSLQMLRGQSAVTQSGVHIALTANISLPEDVKRAVACDAEGIGLFRSELLYLQEGHFPDEDELYHAFRETLLYMGGKRVIIRILDPGTDKPALFPNAPPEENPALGYRAVPAGLLYPKMLLPQLRALLRASAYGSLGIMLPMVVDVSEIQEVRRMLSEARHALKAEGRITGGHIPIGVMVETPAAAMTADLLAQECDFLSIGTNDLTQYILVADRHNPHMAANFNARHPAVMRAIAQVVHAAHAMHVPVSVCGESAADPELAAFFAGLKVDELSMSPCSLLQMKRAIRKLTEEDCKAALRQYLGAAKPKTAPKGAKLGGNA